MKGKRKIGANVFFLKYSLSQFFESFQILGKQVHLVKVVANYRIMAESF